jgi:hypothetical protein
MPNWMKKEALFEFDALYSVYSGENIAYVVFCMLKDLQVGHKLLAIYADNALNNNTIVDHLHQQLITDTESNDKVDDFG